MNKKTNTPISPVQHSAFYGKSVNDLFKIVGSNSDPAKYTKIDEKERVFRDGNVTFKEMKEDKRKDDKKLLLSDPLPLIHCFV